MFFFQTFPCRGYHLVAVGMLACFIDPMSYVLELLADRSEGVARLEVASCFYYEIRPKLIVFSSFQLVSFHPEASRSRRTNLDGQERYRKDSDQDIPWLHSNLLKHLVAAELLGTTELGPGMTWEDEHWKKGTSKLLYQKPTILTITKFGQYTTLCFKQWCIHIDFRFKIRWLMSLPWKQMYVTHFPNRSSFFL